MRNTMTHQFGMPSSRLRTPARARLTRFAAAISLVSIVLAMSGCYAAYPRLQSFNLDAAPTGAAVDVQNERGAVVVRVDPRADHIAVTARVRVIRSIDKEERRELAGDAPFTAELDTSGHAPVLRVRAGTPSTFDNESRVDLLITMPRCTGVRINSSGGDVILVGVSGAVHVENGDGAIELRTESLMNEPVALITDDGDIYYQVSPDSTGAFNARTEDGVIMVRSVIALSDSYNSGAAHRSVLNHGENQILLRTGDGDVHISVRKDPVALTRTFK